MEIIKALYFYIVIIAHLMLMIRLYTLYVSEERFRKGKIIPNRIFYALFDLTNGFNITRLTTKRYIILITECWIPILFFYSIKESFSIVKSFFNGRR